MKKIIISNSLKDFVQQNVSVLAGGNNKIFYVDSGREALITHRREKADLVIIRPDFPDTGCEELCSTIRGDETLRGVSILVACSEDPSDIERCQKCAANDFIQPMTPTTFLSKAMRLLNISERTSYRVIVKAAKRENNYVKNIFCTSQNISSSGLLLETDGLLNLGEKITCSFFLPNSIQITVEGEIARVADKKDDLQIYGVKFTDMSPSLESQISSFTEYWRKRKKTFR